MGKSPVLADTSGIIALLNRKDSHHQAVLKIIESEDIIIPSVILPEVDYLATKYLGELAFGVFMEDLLAGYFTFLAVEINDLQRAVAIMNQYKDVYLGIVDSSIVALAERYEIRKILTLDRRHFSLIKPANINYFQLLP